MRVSFPLAIAPFTTVDAAILTDMSHNVHVVPSRPETLRTRAASVPNARRGSDPRTSPPRNMGYSRTRRCPRTRCRRYLRVHTPSKGTARRQSRPAPLTRGSGIAPAVVFARRLRLLTPPVVPLPLYPVGARAARGVSRRRCWCTSWKHRNRRCSRHRTRSRPRTSRRRRCIPGTLSTLMPVARRREVNRITPV